MSELNKKNINYSGLNHFLQNLRSHDLAGLATEYYVDDELVSKANKVDINIPVDMQTKTIDWTVLNSIETGIYRVQFVVNSMGQTMIMQQGWATVSNNMGDIVQTIIYTPVAPSASGSPISVHNRVSRKNATWFDYDFNIGVINDNNSSSESTYSSSKIDSLISTLEARIAALEGNTTGK